VASNRLPVVLERSRRSWRAEQGSGGLVTALEPVLQEREGIWVGWPGTDSGDWTEICHALERLTESEGYQIHPVRLTARERDDFYLGFSNQVIWPLFHDFQTLCNFDPRFWHAYAGVNRKFAAALQEVVRPGDLLWVHDYHLMSVAEELKAQGIEERMAFFLHIPFPHIDLFTKLPWRFSMLRSLLQYDLIGFQTARDRGNFLHCLRVLVPGIQIEGDDGRVARAILGAREVDIGVFPISIDCEEFAGHAASPAVSERVARIEADFQQRELILGVDRLDYSKGILHKLNGYRLALERYPDMRGKVTLIQLVIPSREGIPEYDRMKSDIEQAVGEIQGAFTRNGWVPIHYYYGTWDRDELIAQYRAADIGLVTPLKDGMNLVAKEYCASNVDEEGVLILSEYAGATAQLHRHALIVDPYDVEGLADAIHDAFTMPKEERRRRMQALRRKIEATDLSWWVDTFLRAANRQSVESAGPPDAFAPRAPEGFFGMSAGAAIPPVKPLRRSVAAPLRRSRDRIRLRPPLP
jgi:trehalose 6-phosphate synthase